METSPRVLPRGKASPKFNRFAGARRMAVPIGAQDNAGLHHDTSVRVIVPHDMRKKPGGRPPWAGGGKPLKR